MMSKRFYESVSAFLSLTPRWRWTQPHREFVRAQRHQGFWLNRKARKQFQTIALGQHRHNQMRLHHCKCRAHTLVLTSTERKMRVARAASFRCFAETLGIKYLRIRPERGVAMGGIGSEQNRCASRDVIPADGISRKRSTRK